MKVLITGNEGYVGTVLSDFLISKSIEVHGFDTGFFADCFLDKTRESIDTKGGDVRRTTTIQDYLGNFDAIVHLAALSNDPLGELNPELTMNINYHSSVRIAQEAKAAGVRRFIFASSCSMYGQGKSSRLTEDDELNPLTSYAISKVKSEGDIRQLVSEDFCPVYLRNATAYGYSPRFRFDLVVNNLVGWALTTGKIVILSDGTPWRPLVHVEDMARAVHAALIADEDRIRNQAFNVGRNEDNYQIKTIAEMIKVEIPETEIEIRGERGGDERSYNVSFDKIKKVLPEFKPEWDVAKGIHQLKEKLSEIPLTKGMFESSKFTRLKRLKEHLSSGNLDSNLFWKEEKND